MSSVDLVKIKVKAGYNEAEVEASLSNIREAINLIPEVLSRLPVPKDTGPAAQSAAAPAPSGPYPAEPQPGVAQTPYPSPPQAPSQASVPSVSIEKGDSLSDVISKFFADVWGRNPRKLSEVREALQSYGLNYPKQSVAVALLRLAKGSRIRRFKGEGGEFVYTASTMAAAAAGTQAQARVVIPPLEGMPPGASTENETEEEEAQMELGSANL